MKFFRLLILLMPLALFSCGGERICEGLNRETGSFNDRKRARKNYHGMQYKTPGERAARERQKKRLSKNKKSSTTKARGKRKTMKGSRSASAGFSIRIGGGKAHASANASIGR